MRAQNIFDIGIFDSGLTNTIAEIVPQPNNLKRAIGNIKKYTPGFAFTPYPLQSDRQMRTAILLTT